MKDFIIGLYANENFPIYLGAIIIVLLIAFFVVFFLGKKDQKKIEQTQRLEKINDDAFKEVSSPVAVNVVASESQNKDPELTTSVENISQTPIVPMVDTPIIPETPIIKPIETPIVPEQTSVIEPAIENQKNLAVQDENLSIINFENPKEEFNLDAYKSPQSTEKIIEEKPTPKFNPEPVIEPYIPEPDLSNFSVLADSIENELTALEKERELAKPLLENATPIFQEPVIENTVIEPIIPVIEMPVAPPVTTEVVTQSPVLDSHVEVELPTSNDNLKPALEEPIQTNTINGTSEEEKVASNNPTKVMTDVFSSVYAPKKETAPLLEDTMVIELPRLKDSPLLSEDKEPTIKL